MTVEDKAIFHSISIRNGYVRDAEGIWHRLDNIERFYIKLERKKGKYYSQVLGEPVTRYDRLFKQGLVEFTRVLGGKKKAQKILDDAFMETKNWK